jgi:hypothetical protein
MANFENFAPKNRLSETINAMQAAGQKEQGTLGKYSVLFHSDPADLNAYRQICKD